MTTQVVSRAVRQRFALHFRNGFRYKGTRCGCRIMVIP
jgi:hypothetical protein